MTILIVSATIFEVAPLITALEQEGEPDGKLLFKYGGLRIRILCAGVGLPATAFSLGDLLARESFDLAVQLGIGGAIDRSLEIGELVEISTDRFADLGAETADGGFLDLNALGLLGSDATLYSPDGSLENPGASSNASGLPQCRGISVNRVHGSESSIDALRLQYPDAQVESMEGAAFFYACLRHQLPMLQLRTISNYVEARDRDKWNIPLAIDRLTAGALELLGAFRAATQEG